jgi:uncharacterized membrane protein
MSRDVRRHIVELPAEMKSRMNRYVAGYLAAVLVMVALDMLWLGVVAKTMYQQAIGHLMAEAPKVLAAIVFYALYALGLVVFALAPQAEDAGWGRTVYTGALFGFFAYATYDLSNLATLRNWPIRLTLIDMAWGTALSATAAAAGKAAINWATKT